MASAIIDRGVFCVRWLEGQKRMSISLSCRKFSKKTVDELCRMIEKLVYYKQNPIEVPDKRTKSWLESANPIILKKLAKAGLIVIPESHTTGELWSAFLEMKTDIKESTQDGYDYAKQRFFAFFNEKTNLSELTKEQFEDWKVFLQTEYRSPRTGKSLVESSTAGTITKTKAVFNWAKMKKWILQSPLEGVGRGSFINRENDRFITMEEYRQLLDACPCSDWKVIIALARIGGLRCPSEVLRLRWTDVNWEKDRFYVTSSKTERYKGKEGRVVPLFPALRLELEKLFFLPATVGTEYVVNRYRDPERTNLGTQFARIVRMAGVEPIPRPFDNMRASRSTEIYADFGEFLESKWIGHSSKIARNHYLQIREEDFERACGKSIREQECSQEKETNHFPASGSEIPTSAKNFPANFPTSKGR